MKLRLPGKGNKYGAKKKMGWSGRMYDSTAESDRANHLRLMEKAGAISDLREQTRVELEPGVHYRTDFDYLEGGRRVYEDVKGVETERFRIICALWRLHGPGPLRITKRAKSKDKFVVVRTILAQ